MKLHFESEDLKKKKNILSKILFGITSFLIIIIIVFFIYPQLKNDSLEETIVKNDFLISTNESNSEENYIEEDVPNELELKLLDNWLKKIPSEIDETEWLIIVDRSEQIEYIFRDRQFIKTYIVSTGSATRYSYDATLPIGIWRIGDKINRSLGEIYGPRLMYIEIWNGSSFEKTAKALHGTNEPENLGQATSMGCIYHSNEDIIELFDWIPKGTLVITVE